MWNKKNTLLGLSALVFLCAFSAFPKEETNQESDDSASSTTAAQPKVQAYSGPPSRFDPKTPILTMKAVKKLMEVDIQKNLLEKKVPDEFSKLKDRTEIITNIGFQLLMAQYNRLVENPELPEVTRINPKWYKAYGEKLAKFKPAVAAIVQSVNCQAPNNYFLAVRNFKSLQEECLLFLKEPMPKISKEQYATLHKANTKQRALDYERYQKERRAAELKEAQERRAKAAKKSTK